MQDAQAITVQVDDSQPKEDEHYKNMHCGLKPVDKASREWTLIEDYVKNTHGGREVRTTPVPLPAALVSLLPSPSRSRCAHID